VSIEGNQISTAGSGDYGIRLLGLVTDSSVQNNQIDGFIGEASPVMRGVGVFSEPLSGNAPYNGSVTGNVIRRCSDGIVAQGVSAGIIKDFTISGNLLEGIVHTQDGRTNTFDAIGTKGIGLDFCANIKVTGNTVTSMGVLLDDARNPVVLGDDVFPLPILARNSDTLHITDNTVMVPVAQGNGVSEGIVVMVSGYGSSYTASNIAVEGNQIVHDSANANSGILFGAIDAVNTPGFINVKVVDNQIVGGKGVNVISQGISFSSGDPFNPGSVYGGTFQIIEVRDNTVTSFDVAGVSFTSGTNAAQVHASLVSRVAIEGNNLVGTGSPTGVQRGVWVDVGSQTQTVGLSNLTVNRNNISGTSGGSGTYGVQIHADKDAASPASATFASVHVTDNLFPSLRDGVAIEVERTGGFITLTRHDLVVTGNRLPSTSTAASAATSGLVLDLGSVDFTGLTIEDNLFEVSDGSAWAVDVSMVAPGPALVSLEDVSFSRNKVRAGDNQTGVRFTTQRASIIGFRFTGNDISSESVASAGVQGVFLNLTNSEATAVNIRRLEVEGNTIVGGRFQINATDTSFTNCSVSDNTLGVTAFAELSARAAVKVYAESNNATTTCSNFRIEGNTITGGNYGISFGMEDFASEIGTRISGNTISGLVAPTNTGSIGINAHAFNRTDLNTADLRIEDNAISDYTYRGIFLGLDPNSNIEARSISVSQNTVLGTQNNAGDADDGIAIEVTMQCGGTCESDAIRVDGNRIGPDEDGNTPFRGIMFTAPSNTTSVSPIENVSISGNQIRVNGVNGIPSYGIDSHFGQVSDDPYTLYDAKFDRNQIRVLAGEGHGLAVEATCRFRTLSISDNNVQGLPLNDGLKHGIRLYHEFTGAQAVSDTSGTNVVGRTVGVGESRSFVINGNPVDAVAWEDLTIANNSVMWNAEDNTFGLGDNAALAVSHVSIGIVAVCLWGYSLTGNTLRARKTTIGVADNSNSEFIGYTGSMVKTSQALWPSEGGPVANETKYIQRGWAFTGNSSTDFTREDSSGGTGLHGLCVNLDFGFTPATTANSGVATGNVAYENGAGSGWGKFGLTAGTNLNGDPRTF
jgi:hypothetical protein